MAPGDATPSCGGAGAGRDGTKNSITSASDRSKDNNKDLSNWYFYAEKKEF